MAAAGKSLTSRRPRASACSTSLGVQTPGSIGMPWPSTWSTTAGLNPGATRKDAPPAIAASACAVVRMVPAPTRIAGTRARIASIAATAASERKVISAQVSPPARSASATGTASSGRASVITGTTPAARRAAVRSISGQHAVEVRVVEQAAAEGGSVAVERPADALVERRLCPGPERVDDRASVEGVRKGQRSIVERDPAAGRGLIRLDRVDDVGDAERAAAEVVDGSTFERGACRPEEGLRRVVGELELVPAVEVDVVRAPGGRRDHRDGRLRRDTLVPSGTVHGVRPQPDARDPIVLPEDPRGLLVGDLVDAVMGGGEELRVRAEDRFLVMTLRAVDGRAARVDDALDAEAPGQLEDRDRAGDVHLGAPDWVRRAERELHRGQVDDPVDPVATRRGFEGRDVRDVRGHEADLVTLGVGQDQPEAIVSPAGGQDDDRDVLLHEVPDDPRTDAARAAGHEDALVGHGVPSLAPASSIPGTAQPTTS